MKKRYLTCLTLTFLIVATATLSVFLPLEVLAAPVTLSLRNPTGGVEVTQLHAARLQDLNGKTICELSNDMWESHRTLPAVGELLKRQFPTAKIIPYTEFPHSNEAIDNDKTVAVIKQKGCQAVIVGNAG
jgi:hypothetical protein